MQSGDDFLLIRSLAPGERLHVIEGFRAGKMKRLARGVYYPTWNFRGLRSNQRSVLASGAQGASGRHLVGRSAAAMWAYPHMLLSTTFRPEVRGRTSKYADGRNIPDTHMTTTPFRGIEVTLTTPAVTVIDVARWHGLYEAVRLGDILARKGKLTRADLAEAVAARSNFANIERARTAAILVNDRSESPRESDVKVSLHLNNIKGFEQQVTITNYRGVRIARLDFLNREHSVGIEYDGRGKTRGQYGLSAEEAANNELSRQRDLECEGIFVVRVTNYTYTNDDWLAQLRHALKVNHGREFPADRCLPYTKGSPTF